MPQLNKQAVMQSVLLPTELRIGNLVTELNIEVISIDIVDLESIKNGDTNYKPIPLTEDWLLKLGFIKGIDKVYYIKLKDKYLKVFEKIGHVLVSTDKFSNCFKISDNIKYVHQLQNLYFSLTQTELTVA